MKKSVQERLAKAKLKQGGAAEARARRYLAAVLQEMPSKGPELEKDLSNGKVATQIGRVALQVTPEPPGLACAAGCAFCCILKGEDGGTITVAEAVVLFEALAPMAGARSGTEWHPEACSALDPDTRQCRAYAARPMICRSYVSHEVDACKSHVEGKAAFGSGVRGAYADYLSAHALARAALGPGSAHTYALREVTKGALAGKSLQETLKAARHKPRNLEDERKRVSAAE